MQNIILPQDFHGSRYGYDFRFVNEDDAEFIVRIRNNPKVRDFLHRTSNDIEAQRAWIRDYKKRERLGLDYYFIYSINNQKCGVNRIYNIKDNGVFTSGSLVFDDNVPPEAVVASTLIVNEIAFEDLGMLYNYSSDGIHIDNKKVIKFNKMFGMVYDGKRETDNGVFLTGGIKKEDFYRCADKVKRLMSI